ncbi:M15 family metallopeptidase [Tessaracoccus sp. HDW20]|uniref:M15 family metallopeptidase n=1 Tax=Tessaracoccus coleopterorum TaxID=2714950 RepID=UPI0018D3C233|nr:M15 family metallopeptidase [Tessaracoccus coleopterorum]NHB85174.1 M15 family metallopeptidase [Tessaracoccus coleopterorum]
MRRDRASDVAYAFTKAFEAGFPVYQMTNLNAFGGDDVASMAANNTSAFNCRKVVGNPYAMSPHSYGYAVDLNPWQNPYRDPQGSGTPARSTSSARPWCRGCSPPAARRSRRSGRAAGNGSPGGTGTTSRSDEGRPRRGSRAAARRVRLSRCAAPARRRWSPHPPAVRAPARAAPRWRPRHPPPRCPRPARSATRANSSSPTTAGGLDEADVARPDGWSPTARPGSTEEGYLGNGTWVHAVSPAHAALGAIALGCAEPGPTPARRSAGGHPERRGGEAGRRPDARVRRRCCGAGVLRRMGHAGGGMPRGCHHPCQPGERTWLGRRNLDTVWSEAVGLRGTRVVLLIVDSPDADLTAALPAT